MHARPPAVRVAQRTLVLLAVAYRGLLERDVAQPDTAKYLADLMPWLDAVGASADLEPGERASIATPLGSLSEHDANALVWRMEAVEILAWALGRVELPTLYNQADSGPAARALGFLAPAEKTVMHDPALRPTEEIEVVTNRYLTVHWRLRDYRLRPDQMNFRTFVEQCNWGPLSLDGLELADDDLLIEGLSLDESNLEDLTSSQGVIAERHKALNWLRGDAFLYSEVDTAT